MAALRPPWVRFIPACAGNSREIQATLGIRGGSSPRVRGTRASLNSQARIFAGSSPRVRGTRQQRRPPRRCRPVHPRVCGELEVNARASRLVAGSSPRVRGTPRLLARQQADGRFIPACAGNSAAATPRRFPSSVHPRVCGELPRVVAQRLLVHGSSPRVRGTPETAALERHGHRFIPACAGNSRLLLGALSTPAVHPRVCGELGRTTKALPAATGSSPRVRGTRT